VSEARTDLVNKQLELLPIASLQQFAASLGEIQAAVAAAFGSAEVGVLVHAAGTALWTPPGKDRDAMARRLRYAIDGLNEADDSYHPDYYTGRAVYFLRRALLFPDPSRSEAQLREELKRLAWDVRDGLSGFDLRISGKGPYIPEPDEPPDPGGLEDGELDREVEALRLLMERPGDQAVREAAQRYAQKVALVVAPIRAGMR
jgi:hypothetical protein